MRFLPGFSKPSFSFSRSLPWARRLMGLSLAAGAWALSAGVSTAHAGGVHWSVGVHVPGVVVDVSNGRRAVVVRPSRRVVVAPAPVVVYPGNRHALPVVIGERPHHHRGGDRRHSRHERAERREARREWREDRRRDRRHGHRSHHHRGHDRH